MAQREGSPLQPEQLAGMYLTAKEQIIEAGYWEEVDWQEEASLDRLDESTFLRESAWVVLSSGFRESILRRRYNLISSAFLDWVSAEKIILHRDSCRANALQVFRNERKIEAIITIAERVLRDGFDTIRSRIASQGAGFLQEFPHIGPITSLHLAKNIGVPVVKPDRHLTRMASLTGYESADRMCQVIADLVGDSLPVIDLVMWRYATIHGSSKFEFEQLG